MPMLRLAGASLLALPATLRSSIFLAALYAGTTTSPSSQFPSFYSTSTSASSSAFDVSRHQYPTMMSQSDPPEAPTGQRAMLARQRAKEEAEARGEKAQKPSWFPLGYRDGFSQWWAGLSPAVTEHKVLSFIPHLQQPPTQTQTGTAEPTNDDAMPVDKSQDPTQAVRTDSPSDPYGPRQWASNLVQLSGKNRALNEFSVTRPGEEKADNNLVMLHGYGAGLGFFYKNFEPLSRPAGWRLYALDLLGMGRSSRPPFKIFAKEKEEKTKEAESWFVDALEEWRVKRGIDKMTLLGHSLGGYLAVCYALKYPGHLNKLILASPVGIPEDPYAVREDIPDPESSTMANEFTQSQDDIKNDNNNKPKPGAAKNQPPPRKMPRWLVTAWDANISPFSLVRLSGPLGPRLVSGWTSRRFSHLPQPEAEALHDYSYSLFRQRGSGEYALTYVLAPGAFARSPLIRRIQGVGRQLLSPAEPTGLEQKVRETGVPIVMMYGDHDWMDVKGGYDSEKLLNEQRDKALATAKDEKERLREQGGAKVIIIKNAGHHVYLDGCDQFNSVILDEMKDVESTQKRLASLE